MPALKVALIVDSDALARTALVERLEASGWLAYQANGADKAVAILDDLVRLDLLVTAVSHADGSCGWSIAEKCRDKFSATPIVYYSSRSTELRRRLSRSKFLTKPFSLSQFMTLVDELVANDQIEESVARQVAENYHRLWSAADVARMMLCCDDDISLRLNTAAPDGGTILLVGKQRVADFLAPISRIAECRTVPFYSRLSEGILRTQVDGRLRHKATGHVLECTYRQVIQFRCEKILVSEEFHDAAMMHSFWKMVAAEQCQDSKQLLASIT